MSKYIIVDGVLQQSTPEAERWAHRAAKQVPSGVPEETVEPKIPKDTRTEYQAIEDLEEQ